MKGCVRRKNGKSGGSWSFVIDAGREPAKRCVDCGHREWVERKPPTECSRCGGELGPSIDERRQLTRAGFRVRKDAEDAMHAEIERLAKGADVFPEKMSVSEWLDRWLASSEVTSKRPRTRESYRHEVDVFIRPTIGRLQVSAIRRRHVHLVLEAAGAGDRSPSSVAHTRAVLSSCLRVAVDLELLDANPVAGVRIKNRERPELSVPTIAELSALLDAARGDTWEIPLLISATTGMRRSEVLGVRWEYVDLDAGRIRVVVGLQRVRDDEGSRLELLGTKTEKSRREVKLPGFAVERLKTWKREQNARRLRLGGAWVDLDLVCDRGTGEGLDPDAFTHGFKRLAKVAKLSPATRLHDVRHAIATALLEAGQETAVAAAVLGHSNPSFTAATYQHVRRTMTDRAADSIGEAFGR